MLKAIILAFCALPTLLFAQITEQQVRFRNEFDRPVQAVTIGDVTYSEIPTGGETEYQPHSSGQKKIKGTLLGQGNIYLDGVIALPSSPRGNWTVVLTARKQFVLESNVPARAGEPGVATRQSQVRNQVRFQNYFTERVAYVRIGPVNFKDIGTEATTRYASIPAGEHEVAVDVWGYGTSSIIDYVYIPEVANKRFTVVFDERGIIYLSEDY